MFFKSLAATAVFGVASAQTFIPVLVGMSPDGTAGTIFSPNRVTAEVGTVIQFQFLAGNHTVTQSTFDNPCVPVSTVDSSATGVHSGFYPAAESTENGMVPFWNLQINDTTPIWLYCAQGQHCQNGMTMVINENTNANQTRSLENFRNIAATVSEAMVPGDVLGGQTNENNNNANENNDDTQDQGAAAGLRVPVALLAAVIGIAYL